MVEFEDFDITSAVLVSAFRLYKMPLISTLSALANIGKSIKKVINIVFFIVVIVFVIISIRDIYFLLSICSKVMSGLLSPNTSFFN
ncbi:MAG: hypothetical protein II398_05935, partial [Prevotella sp.]|nr:hypothetical protein [Prevotella sp.]